MSTLCHILAVNATRIKNKTMGQDDKTPLQTPYLQRKYAEFPERLKR